MKERWVWKSRWAALGAAVAVSIGAGGLFVAQAAPGASESTIVSVTPARVLDTRDPVNLGLPGPFVSPVSQKLQITGSIPTSTGTATVVPTGATGVLLNVTAVAPSAAGFISIRPGDATGAPATSSLNFAAGSVVPNAVQVALPTAGANAGKIDITYDALGVAGPTTDVLIDVVGYMTSAGIQDLTARLVVAEQRIAANRAVFFNSGPTLVNGPATSIATLSLANDQRCILLMNGTTDWDGNGATAVLFLQWNVDGTNVGGSFAGQTPAAEINYSLSAIAGLVIDPGTHAIQLRANSTGTADLEDVGASAQCVPFNGTGSPAEAVAAEIAGPSIDDPNDPTD